LCTGFNEVQTDKRNAYRRKVAADKMAGVHEEGEGPAAKKVRREEEGQVETGAGGAVDGGEMRDAASGEEEEGVEEEEHDEPEDEDEEEHEPEHEHEHERLDVEEQLEEEEHREAEDEALDNGDDSE
jgi:DNA polymerase epsilon subunit 3